MNSIKEFNAFIKRTRTDDGCTTKKASLTLPTRLWDMLDHLNSSMNIDIDGLLSSIIVFSLRIDKPLDFTMMVFDMVQAGARTYNDMDNKKEASDKKGTPFDNLPTTNKEGVHNKEKDTT